MRIIIEEHKYAAADVKDVLKGIDALENVEGYVSVNYVGYFYNTDKDVRDCVFILPKVLLEDVDGKELVFGKYAPEEIINLDAHNPLTQPEKDFIYEFAVWIYRAIVVFHNDKRNKTSIVYHRKIAEVGNGGKRLSNSTIQQEQPGFLFLHTPQYPCRIQQNKLEPNNSNNSSNHSRLQCRLSASREQKETDQL